MYYGIIQKILSKLLKINYKLIIRLLRLLF